MFSDLKRLCEDLIKQRGFCLAFVQSLSHVQLLGAQRLSSSGCQPSSPGVTLEVGTQPLDTSQQMPRRAGLS